MKIALGIEYDGQAYFGWQKQNKVVSVQQKVEHALSIVANEKIDVFCAGRTDAAVHATGQVIHFDTSSVRAISAWTMGVNSHLPSDIAVKWATEVDTNFHARFSALARRYQYIIYNNPLRSAILNKKTTHYHKPLNETHMHQAAQALLGENDFSAFRASQCQSLSPWRHVYHIKVTRKDDFVVVDIKANAFVHHMVRNIVGSLIEVGNGSKPIDWIGELLASKDRTKAAATAKPEGLYLVEVYYPTNYHIPAFNTALF